MNTNDLNMALYEKMAAEQDKYRDWLKSQPPEEILHHTYEYTIREDIVMAMEELELTDAQAEALLESPSPLADVYRYFEKLETGHMDVIRDSIENRANDARWAKVFNLKQMAQTMNYLSENNLLEYAVLEEKAAAATAHHNELSAQIKAAEKRMAEIAVLRTHIVNYAKTREVYVAYRKAGYSKKFREEHEEEILLHQAAKNAFDEMGVKKLPKVKELQTEYAKLLEEKKKTYAEYRRSREEMRELLTAKANVDRVLKMEVEQDVEKEKDHGQR